jgi:hypothetical protein
VSEIIGISDHLGGFLLRRGCPGEKAWFLPRSTPTAGSLTRFVPQPQTPPGLTTSPQTSLPACPAVGLSTSRILSDGSGDIEPPRRRSILPRPEGQGLTRHLVSRCFRSRTRIIIAAPSGQPLRKAASAGAIDRSNTLELAANPWSCLSAIARSDGRLLRGPITQRQHSGIPSLEHTNIIPDRGSGISAARRNGLVCKASSRYLSSKVISASSSCPGAKRRAQIAASELANT